MNEREKEVVRAQLKQEKEIINRLKDVYQTALKDIDAKIKLLSTRPDYEQNLQSIVYQIRFQTALKQQIREVLDKMNENQYADISKYLHDCYDTGFIGSMYDIHGQGIPLIMPIAQNEVIKAIQYDSKLDSMYEKLGVNTIELRTAIQSEISRGIANNYTWVQIGRNVKSRSDITLNKSIKIARTEGHRVAQQATFDAQTKAKQSGADVFKQWDSTLDGRTRPEHRQLDGQVRELDKPFESGGHKAMFPSDFGVANLDVNCRCVLLQRARWALDDAELQTLEERAKYYKLDKSKDFDDFKKKYLNTMKGDE